MSKKASEHGRAVCGEMKRLGIASAQRGDERERRFAELHRMVNDRTLREAYARMQYALGPMARSNDIIESLIQLAEHQFGGTAK